MFRNLGNWFPMSVSRHGDLDCSLSPMAAALVVEHGSDGVLIADMRERGHPIVYVNAAFEAITGYSAVEAVGKNCRYLQGSDRLQPEIDGVRAALAEGRGCTVTLRNYRRDGSLFHNNLKLIPMVGPDGAVTHCIGLIREATHAVGTDRQTGVLDRYGLVDAMASIPPGAGSTLVIKLDVARFHEINSGYGYDAGDALLRAVADRLKTLPVVAVGRVAEDAFVLVIAIAHSNQANPLLLRLARELKPRFVLPGAVVAVQFATGYTIGERGADPVALLRQAGAALHHSKASPMRVPRAFDQASERAAHNRIRLTSELQQALAEGELLFHYQPQVDLTSGALIGAEALLRWDHGAFGLQPPSRFITVAEETGLILDIGAWGLRTIAAFAAENNRARARPLRYAFNVSVVEFTQRDMVALVRQTLAETGCAPEWLTLELTENLMADGSAEIRGAFKALRDLGVGLSIDDFGTGYSNLRYLEMFPISEIKVERSFVHDVAHSAAKRVIIESVIRLGAALDINVVAEGIETEAERAIMRAMGCPTGQGYFFARPLEEMAFRRLLDKGMAFVERWDASRYLSLLDGPRGD